MKFKKLKKLLNINESTISMILGLFVILFVGLFIIKNYTKQEPGETIPSIGTENQTGLENGQRYSVQKNDDLWKISEKLFGSGYEWIKIAEANNLIAPYIIKEGQQLIIPEIDSSQEIKESLVPTPVLTYQPEPTPTLTVLTPNNAIDSETYEVVKGDNLWNIAVRSYGDGYKWVEIAKENNLTNPALIHPGNVFVIPR
jgi:nucleoid-associated protein YgaU